MAADVPHGTWTTLGTLAPGGRPVIDGAGLVAPWSGGWSLDWWVGADDRWHFPSSDTGVRQRLVDGTPVVETALRIPGGDAIHRAYVVRAARFDELLVVEIHNQSPLPFAVALAIRPPSAVHDIHLVDSTVRVGGRPALLLPAPPRLVAGSTLAGGDCAAMVAGGGAVAALQWPVHCPAGLAQAAFLYPLAHSATLRVAVPLSPDAAAAAAALVRRPDRLPSAADAARAWQAQTNRGASFALPPGRLADAVEANRRYLLLFQGVRWPDAAMVVTALDRFGFHAEAAEMLAAGRVGIRRAARRAARWAMTEHQRLTGGEHLRRPAPFEFDDGGLDRLRWLLDAASPTWVWPSAGHGGHDVMAAAEFCSLVRNLLVREVPGGLSLLSSLPDAWLGQPITVHDSPTHAGPLSYAVRWHGERPALLWELQPHPGSGPARLTAPGLDPAWSTGEPAGEALLAGTALR